MIVMINIIYQAQQNVVLVLFNVFNVLPQLIA